MKTICIIPARGGSKRIPLKNIIDFEGKALINWTIDAALDYGKFDRIVVSTDDPRIAKVSEAAGMEVPFLRDAAADDLSEVSLATIAAVRQAADYWSENYEYVVQLLPTCPLRSGKEIKDALNNFHAGNSDFQISCFEYGWMNPWWAVKLDSQQRPEPVFPKNIKARSQDLPALYCPTGAIWIAKAGPLFKSKSFYGEGHTFFPINWRSAVDIDTQEDLHFAKALYRLRLL